jgi:capsule polysaccharide export protein KpsE/RkpR
MHDELRREYQEDEINLLDFWRVLVKYKRLIAAIVVVAFVASVIVSLLLPKVYASTAKIFAPQQEGAGILAQLPGGLAGLASGMLGGGTPADLWVGFLESQTLRDAIIERFDLKKLYESKTIEDARRSLNKRVTVKKSKEGIVSITVEDKVPERAAQMSNAFVEELDRINKKVVMSSGRRMRIFVEKRLDEAKVAKVNLAETEENLKDFQEKYKAIKLDDQSKAIIDAVGLMKGQLMAKEVELQTLLSFATSNNPQVEMLKAEIKALKEGLKELERGTDSSKAAGSQQDIFIPTSKMPELGLRYARLLRDFKIQETIFELLTQQFEMARVQEAKDSPTSWSFQSLSRPSFRFSWCFLSST